MQKSIELKCLINSNNPSELNNGWIDQKSVPELVHQSPNENLNPRISKLLRLGEVAESE